MEAAAVAATCPACEERSFIYWTKCEGCVVRHTARLPKHQRLGAYAALKAMGKSDDEVAAFKALVKVQFDKDQDEAEARRTRRSA